MPEIASHAPGSFCFVELGSTDQQQAKGFYQALFGWSDVDIPMGADGVYTLFQIDGRVAAAAYTMSEKEREQIPAHWQLYIAVENVDEAAKRASELGGAVIEGPFDVADQGRMAVVRDPAGAYFSMWQARKAIGIQIRGVPRTLCWAGLVTGDREAVCRFYEGLFGWKIAAGEHGAEYLHIVNGGEFVGGIPPVSGNAPAHWLIYFQVEDVDGSAGKVRELGGKVLFGPVTMEGVGRMAVVEDAQGAVSALFKRADL